MAKLKSEAIAAREKVRIAVKDKHISDTKLYQHEIRSVLPYQNFMIKSIQRPAGSQLKQLDPVCHRAKPRTHDGRGAIEEQYAAQIERMSHVTGTIEPTILEAPLREFPGHDLEVNAVAVARDMKIISGGEDKAVYVWEVNKSSSNRKLEHESSVKALACTTKDAKDNLCVVGCADGSIYLWNLDKDDVEPVKPVATRAMATTGRSRASPSARMASTSHLAQRMVLSASGQPTNSP